MKSHLPTLFRYVAWADRRVLAALRNDYAQYLTGIIGCLPAHRGLEGSQMKFFTSRVIGMLESLPDAEDVESPLPSLQIAEQLTEMILGAASSLEHTAAAGCDASRITTG